MACQPFGANVMSVIDSIQNPEAKIKAIDSQTMLKKRDRTPDINVRRSGGAKCFKATGRKAKMTRCRIPDDRKDVSQTNADAKRTSLSWPSSGFCS